MSLSDRISLGDARAWLRERIGTGDVCPCCEQYARVYKRPLNAGMARALIEIYHAGRREWVDKRRVLRGFGAAARDESQLRHWGLLEEDPTRAGWWRVTAKGEDFLAGRIRVPKRARIYNTRFLGLTGELVDISACLKEPFSLEELMAA